MPNNSNYDLRLAITTIFLCWLSILFSVENPSTSRW